VQSFVKLSKTQAKYPNSAVNNGHNWRMHLLLRSGIVPSALRPLYGSLGFKEWRRAQSMRIAKRCVEEVTCRATSGRAEEVFGLVTLNSTITIQNAEGSKNCRLMWHVRNGSIEGLNSITL
jgi:hypothetical protein